MVRSRLKVRVRGEINERILKRDGIKRYTLDVDAMEIMGKKADALFTYNGNRRYIPVAGFLYETPVCLYDEFREGNAAPAFGQKDERRQALKIDIIVF